jgi:peptidoglycan/xylan/chitin deacetylase (PgdA/CDA1 family)
MGRVKRLLIEGFAALGPAAYFRSASRDSCVVLTYHGVVPTGTDPAPDQEQKFVLEADFVRQLEFLKKHYTPVSLEQFEASCLGGPALPPRSALITIDDGYENVSTHMAPHLNRMGIPAALYITTGFLDTTTTLWTNQVEMWWADLRKKGTPPPALNGRPGTLGTLKAHLKSLMPAARQSQLTEWIGDAGARLPESHIFRMMTWDQARRIETLGVALGSHTVTHAILAHEDDASARREIVESRQVMERELGHPVTTLAYPNGGPGFFLPRDEALLAENGYTLGLSMLRGRHHTGDNRYAIRRIAVGREEGWLPLFAARMAFPYEVKDRMGKQAY